jgi:hypothetical protein
MPKRAQANKRRATIKKSKGLRGILNEQSNLILLFAVLIILTGSLFLSDKGITGFASTVNGSTRVNISSEVSVNISYALIDFGTCVPGSGGLNISSNMSSTPSECDGGIFPSWFVVQNIGNVDIQLDIDAANSSNISAYTNPLIYCTDQCTTAGEFTWGAVNETDTDGCNGTLTESLVHFDEQGSDQTICTSLEYSNQRAVNVTIQMYIPVDMNVGNFTSEVEFIGTTL